jgi:hypothetical protein
VTWNTKVIPLFLFGYGVVPTLRKRTEDRRKTKLMVLKKERY